MRIKTIVVTSMMSMGLLAACGGKSKATDTTTTTAAVDDNASLYDRLGKKDAIVAVVDDFVANVAADARINAFFANADVPAFKAKLVDQICEVSGGPCKYTGKNMKEAHTGMGVKDEDFNALVEDLIKSLDKFKVPEKEKGELLTALGAMKEDIVAPQ